MLPDFSLDYVPLPEHGREDKIAIEFGTWFVYAHEENLHLFREHLAPPREDATEIVPGANGWIFRVPNMNSPVTKEMRIRKRDRLTTEEPPPAPYPLFTGKLLTQVIQPPEGAGPGVYRLKLFLNLNAQRFARHQSRYRPPAFIWPGCESVCKGPVSEVVAGEFALSGEEKDNWIPMAGRAFGRMLEPERWPSIRRHYLQQVRHALHSEFVRSASLSECIVNAPPSQEHYSISNLEVAFDLRHDNPLGLLKSLEGTLRLLYHRFYYREYPAPAGLPNNDLNCPVWCIKIRAGVYFKIYAKTNRRLRIEIIHDFSDRTMAHTFTSSTALCALLNNRRVESAGLIQEVLGRIRSLNPPQVNPAPPFAFLTAWFSAFTENTMTMGEHVLRILVYQDCIRLASNDPLREAVVQLRTQGLLTYVGGRRNGAYHVAAPHRPAIEWLKRSALQDGIRQARLHSTRRVLRGISTREDHAPLSSGPHPTTPPQARVRPYSS